LYRTISGARLCCSQELIARLAPGGSGKNNPNEEWRRTLAVWGVEFIAPPKRITIEQVEKKQLAEGNASFTAAMEPYLKGQTCQIIFYGPVGTGKTCAGYALCLEATVQDRTVEIVDWPRLLDLCSRAFGL